MGFLKFWSCLFHILYLLFLQIQQIKSLMEEIKVTADVVFSGSWALKYVDLRHKHLVQPVKEYIDYISLISPHTYSRVQEIHNKLFEWQPPVEHSNPEKGIEVYLNLILIFLNKYCNNLVSSTNINW